ncbi:MAG: hypothetical protein HY329_07705 [Chloroflexi bacterium]|nr:hypothetical protein [Chloroflexota bacterium]
MSVSELTSAKEFGDAIELVYELGWTDGLPCVPPTGKRVDAMLAAGGRPADELIGEIPPKGGRATVEKIAINAVLAGCRPEYFPIVLAAVEASLDDRFNLRGVQGSTHICTPLIIVNGPVAERLDVNSAAGCFGQGWRANATIGRALKLVLTNLGQSVPGDTDKATFGHPGKYTYCVAENEAASPWEPLHVERGFDPGESTVTIFPAEAPHNVNNPSSADARELLLTMAHSMNYLGSVHFRVMGEVLVVFGPEHANIIGQAGWKKSDVRQFLFEHARRSMREIHVGGHHRESTREKLWPRWLDPEDLEQMVPIVRRPQDITVMVAGGAGRHSLYLPGWGSRSATRRIRDVA